MHGSPGIHYIKCMIVIKLKIRSSNIQGETSTKSAACQLKLTRGIQLCPHKGPDLAFPVSGVAGFTVPRHHTDMHLTGT